MSDTPKCWTHKFPTARKRHKCCECRGWIEPGEKYELFSGVWDYPATFKTCSDCAALRRDADKGAPYYDATPFGQLYEWASEEGGEGRARYVAIMQKRGANIHASWLREEAK